MKDCGNYRALGSCQTIQPNPIDKTSNRMLNCAHNSLD